jgi:hypothetical protein
MTAIYQNQHDPHRYLIVDMTTGRQVEIRASRRQIRRLLSGVKHKERKRNAA